MEQRTSVMISAIVFAAVVAGAIAYLVYTNPSDEVAVTSTTPTPQQEGVAEVTPPTLSVATPVATPDYTAVEITTPTPTPQVASAVSPSAPTGPAEITLAATLGSILVGVIGLRRVSA